MSHKFGPACDVASIAPEACEVFYQDYSRRFALMHAKHPILSEEDGTDSAEFFQPGRWESHMMDDGNAERDQYTAGQLLKPLPCKSVRVPPRIFKALTEMIEDDTSVAANEVEEDKNGHLWPFREI
jgi:hypothetical protein